jgi:multiple sugar transport system ATP-binding protein
MAGLRLDSITKIFDDTVRAVSNVTLEIADGEFLVLVGPSGCGKTTLLRMIAGLDGVTSGAISIGDQDATDLEPRDRDVAMVFQNYALYPHMTVEKNLGFALKMRKVPKEEIARCVGKIGEQLNITELFRRRPASLSGGQQQRVALGRAMVREPSCFLLDEPLSNLDAALRVQMRAELKALHERLGATIIHVTHDQEEAMTLGTRVAVMADGELQQVGAPLDVYRTPANRFVAGFVGTPAMNFIDGKLEWTEGEASFVDGDLRVSIGPLEERASAAAVLGIRPEGLTMANPGDTSTVAGEVTFIEILGERMDVHVQTDRSALLTARMTANDDLSQGDRIRLAIDPGAMHFFEQGEFGRRFT